MAAAEGAMSGPGPWSGAEPERREPRLVLASGSPRRRELLELLGIPCRVDPSGLDELQLPGETAAAFAHRAARDKALAVAGRGGGLPVLGSDTVVEIDGLALGKPAHPAAAAAMLRRLSGRDHYVHTGVALAAGGSCESLVDTARVRFLPLDEAMIQWYVETGEPMDKAGAYAVQGCGGLLVAGIEGSPSTVIGLPIHRLPELFARCGLDLRELSRRP
jgi:septum formation protein